MRTAFTSKFGSTITLRLVYIRHAITWTLHASALVNAIDLNAGRVENMADPGSPYVTALACACVLQQFLLPWRDSKNCSLIFPLISLTSSSLANSGVIICFPVPLADIQRFKFGCFCYPCSPDLLQLLPVFSITCLHPKTSTPTLK